jgi:hypothetical protein
MRVTWVESYRDGGTGSIQTLQDDGSVQEYFIHSNNFSNNRKDVTKGKMIPVIGGELVDLINAFRKYVSYRYNAEFERVKPYEHALYYGIMESFLVTCKIVEKTPKD